MFIKISNNETENDSCSNNRGMQLTNCKRAKIKNKNNNIYDPISLVLKLQLPSQLYCYYVCVFIIKC